MAHSMNNSRPDKKRKTEKQEKEKDIDTSLTDLEQGEKSETEDVKDIIAIFENDIKHYDNAMRNYQNEHQKFKIRSKETVQKLRNILKKKDSKTEINLKTNQESQEVEKQNIPNDSSYQDNSNLQTINDDFVKPYSNLIESTSLPNSNFSLLKFGSKEENDPMDYSDCEAMSDTADTDSGSTENEKHATKQDQVLSSKSNQEVRLQNAGKLNMAGTNTPQFKEIEIPKKYSANKRPMGLNALT